MPELDRALGAVDAPSARWPRASPPGPTCGSAARLFSSIIRTSRSWSRLPQFTPMRTGLSLRQAISIISANCESRLLPRPTLPGLMRYLASASAQAGMLLQQLVAVEMKIADQRHGAAERIEPVADMRHRGGRLGGIDGDAHQLRARARPARAPGCAVAATSAVSVLVIDCTTIGALPPIVTPATRPAGRRLRYWRNCGIGMATWLIVARGRGKA